MAARPKGKSRLEDAERFARIIGKLLIPLVIRIIGALISQSVAMIEVRQKYVELAAALLTRTEEEVDQGLRVWAVEVFQKHAPIPLAPETAQRLRRGDIVLPGLAVYCTNECSPKGAIRWLDSNPSGVWVSWRQFLSCMVRAYLYSSRPNTN